MKAKFRHCVCIVKDLLDPKSGIVMGILFYYMLGLITYCHLKGVPIQAQAVIFALGVLAGKVTTNVLTPGKS